MHRARISCFTMVMLFALPAVSAYAQSAADAEKARTDAAAAAAQQEQARREQADRERSQAALRDFLNNPTSNRRIAPGTAAELEAKFLEFRMAVPKFRSATVDFSMALGLGSKLDKPLKNIETQTDVLLRYLTAAKLKHPQPDPAEFKDYSQSELAWETLNTAEHISAYLDLAVAAERQDVVNAKTLEFLYVLDGGLKRLKWLTTHTK